MAGANRLQLASESPRPGFDHYFDHYIERNAFVIISNTEIRMGIAKFSATVLTALVVLATGISASGFENSGIGLKARGMSGAFRAIADDWTAAYYNPAGYAYILDNQFGSAWAFMHHRDEIVPNAYWGDPGMPRGIFNDRVNYNTHEVLTNPSAGLVLRLPVAGETVFGLSAYQRFDQNISWRLFQPLPTYSVTNEFPNDQFSVNLDVVTFQLTAAKELAMGENMLALGLGLQLQRADLIYSNVFFRENPITNSPDDPFYDVMQDYPFDLVTQYNRSDGSGWGFGVNAGAMIEFSEHLKAGLTANYPAPITISGTANSEFFLPDASTMATNPPLPEVVPGTIYHLFVSGAVVRPTSDFEVDLDLPPSMGLGLAYQATDRLMLSIDAEYTIWSQFEGLQFSYSNTTGLFGPADTVDFAREFFTEASSAPVDWDNTLKVMLGGSYELPEFLSPELGLTLVAGLSADQSPTRNSGLLTPQFIDTGNKYGFSGGGILHLDRWDLGLVTTYTHQQSREVWDLDMDDTFMSFPGQYEADIYETILSFNYRF